MPKQTPSQTVGPYFAYGLTPVDYGRSLVAGSNLLGDATQGERIRIEGVVYDGNGAPVSDSMIEIWQANAAGRYDHPEDGRDDVALDQAFHGFGRVGTDKEGRFHFDTVKPGPVPGRGNSLQAPHISMLVFARGMPNHAFTRVYFPDETEANANDPVLAVVPEDRRGTLVATRLDRSGTPVYRFDIHLQGDEETVFFDA
jgi:protocatechuate 3,4-dioxygenase alpha subunit